MLSDYIIHILNITRYLTFYILNKKNILLIKQWLYFIIIIIFKFTSGLKKCEVLPCFHVWFQNKQDDRIRERLIIDVSMGLALHLTGQNEQCADHPSIKLTD